MSNINLWLKKRKSHYSNFDNRNYINKIFNLIYGFLKKNDDKLETVYSPNDTRRYLYIFLFNKNLFDNTSCEMIDAYFTSDIVDLYFDINIKCDNFLYENNINSDDLLKFLNFASYYYEEDFNVNEDEEMLYVYENIM